MVILIFALSAPPSWWDTRTPDQRRRELEGWAARRARAQMRKLQTEAQTRMCLVYTLLGIYTNGYLLRSDRLQTFSLLHAVEHSKTSDTHVEPVEEQWTYLTGAEGQPNRIVCRDGYEVFNILRGAFSNEHYVGHCYLFII